MLIFQNLLQRYIPIMQYFDEALAISVFPISIIYIIKKRGKVAIKKSALKIISCLTIILIIGMYSIYIYKYCYKHYIKRGLLL